ncbi:MAG TPA: GntR family transcriptional regulator [Nocardioides sp.]|uniref:FadR/GntR family transcriptional regulator n=1 Tax=Nocardioides sp. TaxID=35761 RepID=UPI002B58138E|nr:GntR family transcriptional regulator [Nocardioides sp.]HQR26946.1 GntR family transcriptional regulator [Nocardioides sp.]
MPAADWEVMTPMSSLSPLIGEVSSGGRADDVVQRITEAIHLGLLHDGEQLPVEVELARQFGIAPMTVREALAELRARGLVETRRGRKGGSFVKRPAGPPVEYLRATLAAMTVSELRDLVDEHVAVAGQAARLAAERASAVNVRRLFALTEQLGSATTLGEQIRADTRFHIELAIAAHSERLTRREVALQAEVSGLLWLPLGPPVDVGAQVAAHHALAVAVAAEDPDRARDLAEEHVGSDLHRLVTLNLLLSDEAQGDTRA